MIIIDQGNYVKIMYAFLLHLLIITLLYKLSKTVY